MRIAFCLSGQLRNEDAYFPSIAKMAAALNATVFVSTWRQKGTKLSGAQNIHQLPRIFGPLYTASLPDKLISQQGIMKAFPNFEDEVKRKIQKTMGIASEEAIREYFPEAIIDIEDTQTTCLDFITASDDNNSLRMLYKVWRCNELKRQHEKVSGKNFDIVLRMRPDIIPRPIVKEVARNISEDSKNILVTETVRPNYVSDIVGLSNSSTANYYASLFGKAILSPQRRWTNIHPEMYTHLREGGISLQEQKISDNVRVSDSQQHINRETLIQLCGERIYGSNLANNEQEAEFFKLLFSAAHMIELGHFEAAELTLSAIDSNLLSDEAMASYCIILFMLGCSAKNDNLAITFLLHAALIARHFKKNDPFNAERYKILFNYRQKCFGEALPLSFSSICLSDIVASSFPKIVTPMTKSTVERFEPLDQQDAKFYLEKISQ